MNKQLVREVLTTKDISYGGGHRPQLWWAKFIAFLKKQVHAKKNLGQSKGQIRCNKGIVHEGSRSWMNLEAPSFKSDSSKKHSLPVLGPWETNLFSENQKQWFLHFEISQTTLNFFKIGNQELPTFYFAN